MDQDFPAVPPHMSTAKPRNDENIIPVSPDDFTEPISTAELYARRQALGFTQSSLSKTLGDVVSERTIKRWETGSGSPSMAVTAMFTSVILGTGKIYDRVTAAIDSGEITELVVHRDGWRDCTDTIGFCMPESWWAVLCGQCYDVPITFADT